MAYSIKGYSNLRKITEGGTGIIYCGTERSRNRKVVIKKLNYEKLCHPFNFKKFESEAAILTSLYHDSIIRTYDYGESHEAQYIAMEYIDGPDLEKMMSWPEYHRDIGLMAVIQALEGLHYAHRKGIVHGDIKPSNILVSLNGQAKLSDFGLSQSKIFSTRLEEMKNSVTTPLFMPPEQAKRVVETGAVYDALVETSFAGENGQDQSVRERGIQWDLWSVGVLLYRVCSGTYPFYDKDLAILFHAIAGIREKNILELVPDLPPRLAQVITACLEKDAKKRPSSLEPVLSVLHDYFAGVSMEDGEMAIKSYIRVHLPAAVKQIKLSPVKSDKSPIGPVLEEESVPDGSVVKVNTLQHSRRLPVGIFAGVALITLSGILFFRYVHHGGGMATGLDAKQLIAATKVPGWDATLTESGTIRSEQAETREISSRSAPGSVSEKDGTTAMHRTSGRDKAAKVPRLSPDAGSAPRGILKMSIDPAGAGVLLDEKAVANVELTRGITLNAGTCEVLVTHPGYDPFHGILEIAAGRTHTVPIVLLPEKKGKGQLHVYSYPWADLYIDDVLAGTTPTQALLSLGEGEHTVVLKRDGFRPYRESITVKKDEVTRLQITLNRIDAPEISTEE
ncbi:MAG: serine/threonine protein kinase [Chitinispirillaceae bacterium]|nr:serine/threonine protein kinase [Chitinispirillaceae bacterium]